MRRRRRERGSLTVFLALLLPCFLIFTGTCLEYARAQTVSYQVQAAASSAAQSVFAGFSRSLLSGYALMGRLVEGGDFSALSEETKRYAAAYGGAGSVSFEVTDALWQNVVFVTDQNGAVFTAMAAEAMRESLPGFAAESWLRRLGLSGDDEQTAILTENAGKDELTADSLLSGYGEWKESFDEAERALRAEEAAAEEDREEGAAEEPSEAEEDADKAGSGSGFLTLLTTVRSVLQEGVLGLVLPEGRGVPSGQIPTDALPSSLSDSEKSRRVGSVSVSYTEELLLREYLVRSLDCFTTEADKEVSCELEYVLAGKSSDSANLKATVHRLLWIRTGMNLLTLARSSSKSGALREAATQAVGWLGGGALVEGLLTLLKTAWAFSEAVVDVRELLDGGTVPLLKTEESWNLSLENLGEDWNRAVTDSGTTQKSSGEGLSYADYLRICLALTSNETVAYRAMDVISWNVRRSDPSFTLSNCLVSGELTVTAETSPLFASMYGWTAGAKAFSYTRGSSCSYESGQ